MWKWICACECMCLWSPGEGDTVTGNCEHQTWMLGTELLSSLREV